MDELNCINRVELVFFTGTGGTRRIAAALENDLRSRGIHITVKELGTTFDEDRNEPYDLRILLFPIYAFDAPKPVYDWIESKNGMEGGEKIAVISVSGGGEVWPNTGCREECCEALEKKGFLVIYDAMMCMPANLAVQINDHLAMWLIKAIPQKVSQVLDDVLSGNTRRTNFRKGPVRRYLSRLERESAHKFAHGLEISNACISCGWCAKNCPTSNIELTGQEQKPMFLDHCTACLRCIYGCPYHAIIAKSRVIFKKGFDLDAVEKRMEGVDLKPVEKCCKGWALKGIKDYLLDKDFH